MVRFAPRQVARTVAFTQHQHVTAIGSSTAARALTARWLSAAAAPGPKVCDMHSLVIINLFVFVKSQILFGNSLDDTYSSSIS
jgi:hypothetical protein